jgi:hypothetical protein
VFLPVSPCKTNSFSCPGGFCWPIGVTVALLRRLLPSDGPELVKKKTHTHTHENFGPKRKSAPDRPRFDRPSYFEFVWRNAFLPKITVNFTTGNAGSQSYRWFSKTRPCRKRIHHSNFWTHLEPGVQVVVNFLKIQTLAIFCARACGT